MSFRDADGITVDRGLALFFPAPHSFTGEDVLELHCHGGPTVLALITESIVELGARRAASGEFSERAFMNDKLDLVQAEAIADLIESGTAQAARAALRSLAGEFSLAVNALVGKLTGLRVYVEAAIDFPEEEVDFLSDAELLERVADCRETFATLLSNARVGRVLRDGFQVVLVGEPNAGKSSLMNRLSGEETAIVTEIAGTTRDILREHIDIDGLDVELIDTAGLRDNPDVIEKEGMRRAREAMANADAVLWIQDASAKNPGEITEDVPADIPLLIVRNKSDLVSEQRGSDQNAVSLSAKTGDGLAELRETIRGLAGYRNLGEGAFTARRRHVEALKKAASHFAAGEDALKHARAGELFAEELRLSQRSLGEITGAVSSDALLGHIFSTFCIGK